MLQGTVTFRARIKGNGSKFPLLDFNPGEVGVDKVEVEGPDGSELLSTVHLSSVATREDGKALARNVTSTALNRLSFLHSIAIENERITGNHFSPLHPQPGDHPSPATENSVITGEVAKVVLSITAADLKIELEQPSLPGEHLFGLFRSARQSMSPVEEFMHLYHILLMVFDDSQSQVDYFIFREDPTVPRKQHPRKKPGVMEPVYSRLRNEFGHKREGVNVEDTKAEMVTRLGGLVALTKRAIESYPERPRSEYDDAGERRQ